MVYNTTFNNFSIISWQSVGGGVPGENHGPVASKRFIITIATGETDYTWFTTISEKIKHKQTDSYLSCN
jgi:hypothetical protein